MYLHIGNNYMLRKRDIVGIFDMDNATWSHLTRATLTRAEQRGALINAAGDEIPNAFIVCDDQTVYLSMLTAATLRKRME